jgi:hypothetical protein
MGGKVQRMPPYILCIVSEYGSRAPLRGPGMTVFYSEHDPGSTIAVRDDEWLLGISRHGLR